MKREMIAGVAIAAIASLSLSSCSNDDAAPPGAADERLVALFPPSGPTTADTPVGLAVEIDDGNGVPLHVRLGQTFYINQIDIRASTTAHVDEGVDGLANTGDFSSLQWGGVSLKDTEFVLLPNADGTFTRRRFYKDAVWILQKSSFTVTQVDGGGEPTAAPVTADAGLDGQPKPGDDFFVRRLRAIQWTDDCQSLTSCAGASKFREEALVELRNALHPEGSIFKLKPTTTALRVTWSLLPDHPYTIPVQQDAPLPFDYGFTIDLSALTPPDPNGAYLPGSDIMFQITLRDGAGDRLHAPGTLPTYNDVVSGANAAGIQYYRAFFDPTATYWRRKHRERMLMTQIIGPAQSIQPIRSQADLGQFLATEVQDVGLPGRDGVFGAIRTFPPGPDLFGGAIDPNHAAWFTTQNDSWSYRIPSDAAPGTYLVSVKGRRTYRGEDRPFTRTIEIQVGSPVHTSPVLTTGGCAACHAGPSSLGRVLHANDDRAACAACHVPLGFELEGPIYVRTHYLHARSGRFDAPLSRCAVCHLSRDSIQRTSKSACLSCHRKYSPGHVAKYGPIVSSYVGGGDIESFQQCSDTCHTTHPGSGL